MAEYDSIAEQYKQAKQLDVFKVTSHSLFCRLGDVTGKSVLDLACGEGFVTRALKQRGAGRAVGVDLSGEMIRLAREAEAKNPLGIEYRVSAVQDLEKIDDFDIVTATYLLNYAPTRDDLLKMCQAVHRNLKSGHRFVTINDNCGRATRYPKHALDPYGFRYEQAAAPLQDGAPLPITILSGDQPVTFTAYYFSRDTYEWALREAGFKTIAWHAMSLPPDMEQAGIKEQWTPFFEVAPIVVIECQS